MIDIEEIRDIQRTTAADLIKQKAALQAQETAMIEALLKERTDLDRNYGETKDRIAADLKALGWHRTREAKAAGEGAPVTEIKRSRKGKAA